MSEESIWTVCTDGSGYKEGMSVSAAVVRNPYTGKENGLICVRNEADAYRGELEAIILSLEFIAEYASSQQRTITREYGMLAYPRQKVNLFSDCKPAVETINANFHQCSDAFEKYSMRLMCAKRHLDVKCYHVPRNVILQQRHCDHIASGLRVVVKEFLEDNNSLNIQYLRDVSNTEATSE